LTDEVTTHRERVCLPDDTAKTRTNAHTRRCRRRGFHAMA